MANQHHGSIKHKIEKLASLSFEKWIAANKNLPINLELLSHKLNCNQETLKRWLKKYDMKIDTTKPDKKNSINQNYIILSKKWIRDEHYV